MIDVNKITSTLAKLPDAQLQQYAQMHKADPYIMSLAMSESNRRKELRSAAQAPSAQEQPKVVDQEIANMAQAPQQAQAMPEDQGIAQIPAGNMEFAGGGIIAFADGGGVERYQYGGNTTFDPSGMPVYQQAEQVDEDVPTIRERLGLGNRENRRVLEQVEADAAARNAPAPRATAAPAAPVAPPQRVERVNERPALAEEAPASAAPSTGGLFSIDALQKKYFGDYDGKATEAKDLRLGLVQGIKDLAATSLAEVKADQAAEGDVFKGREERLAKREQGLAGLNDKYMGLALFQAGAAMMSTPGGIAAAIGKSVPIGVASYTAGLDKINAAQEKFAEARDRLDDLRTNRKDMNKKELRAATRDVNTASLKGQELMLSGLEKDWGIERDMLGKVFTAATEDLKTSKIIAGQAQIAGAKNAQDKMTAQIWKAALEANDNDPLKARAAMLNLEAEGKRDTGIETSKKEIAKKRVDIATSVLPEEMKVKQQAALDAYEANLDKQIAKRAGNAAQAGAPRAMPLPANASAETLTPGATYQTARGPAKWTGTGFAPI